MVRLWTQDPLPYGYNERWLRQILNARFLNCVEKLEVELVTPQEYSNRLQSVIHRLSQLKGKTRVAVQQSGSNTQLKPYGKPQFRYTRPPNIKHEDDKAQRSVQELDYLVAVLTWKAVPPFSTPETEGNRTTIRTDMSDFFRSVPVGLVGRQVLAHPLPVRENRIRGQCCRHGWLVNLQFQIASHNLRLQNLRHINVEENERRTQVLKAFADIEARRMLAQWDIEGSLLEFEDDNASL